MTWFSNMFKKKKSHVSKEVVEMVKSQVEQVKEAVDFHDFLIEKTKAKNSGQTTTGSDTLTSGMAGNIWNSGQYQTTKVQPGPPSEPELTKTLAERIEGFHNNRKHSITFTKCKSCKVVRKFYDYEIKLFYAKNTEQYPPGMAGPNLHWNKKKTETLKITEEEIGESWIAIPPYKEHK